MMMSRLEMMRQISYYKSECEKANKYIEVVVYQRNVARIEADESIDKLIEMSIEKDIMQANFIEHIKTIYNPNSKFKGECDEW